MELLQPLENIVIALATAVALFFFAKALIAILAFSNEEAFNENLNKTAKVLAIGFAIWVIKYII